jgi:hypothetical protein
MSRLTGLRGLISSSARYGQFERRGYSRDTAALIYFTKYPDTADTVDEDEDEGFGV